MQLRVSLNIPDKDVNSEDVEQDDIPTLIRFFNEGNRPNLYQPNAFVYAWGSFLSNSSDSGDFHILLHANSVDRSVTFAPPARNVLIQSSHPGDQEDTDSYFMHCPEAAQPIVTLLGVVLERGGQLNCGSTLLHYRLQCTVYNSSSRTHHTFPVTAYFKNGQRWANFPPLNINTHVFLTGRIFGVTKENRQLAVITDDIHFLPTIIQSAPPTPSSTTGKRKRHDRWSQRATPRTPSKSTTLIENDSTSIIQPSCNPTETSAPNDDHEETQMTWPDTADDAQVSPQPPTPTPERRSQRPRKTSYVDILAQSKRNI